MTEEKTETLEGEVFGPSLFREKIVELGFIPCLSGSKFCLLSFKPHYFPKTKKDEAVGSGRRFI